MSYLFLFHVECAKAFYARCVDDVAVARYGKHFREGSGVHTFIVVGGDFAGFDVQLRQNGVDEGGFSYSGVSGEEGYSSFEFFLYRVDAFAGFGRYLEARVADGGIKADKPVQIAKLIFVVGVCFIEYDVDRDAVCFGRGKEAVYECSGRFRIIHRYHQHALVEVGSEDMGLFG